MFGDRISGASFPVLVTLSSLSIQYSYAYRHRLFLLRPIRHSRGIIHMAVPHEKSPAFGPYTETSAPSKNSALFSAFTPLASVYSRFSGWRTALGFPNPGTVENLQKEVKSEHFVIHHLLGGRFIR